MTTFTEDPSAILYFSELRDWWQKPLLPTYWLIKQ